MTLTKNDWKRLQWSIAMLVTLLLAGGAIVTLSAHALSEASKTNKQAQSDKMTAHGKAERADQEAEELREKIAVFQTLNARGVIGQEHRLDWIEKISKVKKARKLLEVGYELDPQQKLDAKVVSPTLNGFDIMSSSMKLKMAMLHENDLLNFLEDLRTQIQGYIRVESCGLARLPASPGNHGPAAQIQADCVLDWITIRENR